MPCFGAPDDEPRYPLLCVKCTFPPDPGEYLPRLTEHQIQTEPDDVIDDPSSVFFDPNEKAGFVYTHVPSISFDYAKQLILRLPDSKQEKLSIAFSKKDSNTTTTITTANERERQMSLCSDFADSLDRTPSLRESPLHDSGNHSSGFNEHFKPISRQDSLEFDPIVDGSICQVTLNNKDFGCRPTKDLPAGLSEDDVRTLYKTSHEPFFIDDFNEMHIYEENILNDITKTNSNNKGYISDAESVKTYQDSGIYDDDIIIESPSRLNHQQYPKGDMFDEDENEHDMHEMEKYSAFKTPLSSRHNSLEYLPLDSPLKSIIKHPRKSDHRGRKGEDLDGTAGSENDSLDNELKETFLDIETSEKRSKKADKYSHIQAKVQCFRSKTDRSPTSLGTPTRRKTPESKNTTKRSDLKRTQSRIGAKPKVDSLSNVKYTPGGGGTKTDPLQPSYKGKKVFKEKLKFRENAQPRTDTHGIEMYAHLPTEFQEIARRLARQDSQLKEQKTRGRSLSRTHSSSSRPSSRSPKRGRSRTKKSKMTAGDSISNIQNEVKQSKQLEQLEAIPIVKRPTLSRSSSIRSVPSAPKIHQRHPSSSKITRTPSGSQSPSASTPRASTPSNPPKTKKKVVSKTKGERKAKDERKKVIRPKGNEKMAKMKMKQDTEKIAETTQKLTANTLQMAENTAKITDGLKHLSEDTIDLQDSMTYMNESKMIIKERGVSDNLCSLSQYISDNESFGCRQPRGVPFNEDVKINPLPALSQYITDHEILDSSQRREDISMSLMKSVCQYTPDNELFDAPQLSTNRFQVPAH